VPSPLQPPPPDSWESVAAAEAAAPPPPPPSGALSGKKSKPKAAAAPPPPSSPLPLPLPPAAAAGPSFNAAGLSTRQLSAGAAQSLAQMRALLLAHIAGLEDGVETACARAAAGASDASHAVARAQLAALLALTETEAWRGVGAAPPA